MSTYPLIMQQLEPEGSYNIPSGTNRCSEFYLGEETSLVITMIKPPATQDFSIRCWVSERPGGSSVELIRPMVSHWHPDRAVMYKLCFHTTTEPLIDPHVTTHSLKLKPGKYYLNALNLVNGNNKYVGDFTFTGPDSTPETD